MDMSFLTSSDKKKYQMCFICNEKLTDLCSSPDTCSHLFHYKCLRKYVDNQLDNKKSVICPEKTCEKFFGRIANKYKKSDEIFYQNVMLSNDETQCCICFSRYKVPVASSDSCSHTFCCECLKKWCTFKHECPMDRMPIKMLLISEYPGGHIFNKMEPPAVEQDLNGDGDNDELVNTTCEVCNSGQDEHQLLLCDNCNRGYHIYCLPEPLSTIPEGDWFCEQCQDHSADDDNDDMLPRGVGRIVANLTNILSLEDPSRQTQQRRNNSSESRRTRATNRSLIRQRRAVNTVESDNDLSDENGRPYDMSTRLRQDSSVGSDSDNDRSRFRNRVTHATRRGEGVRTRRGRVQDLREENVHEELSIGIRSRRRRYVSDESETDSRPVNLAGPSINANNRVSVSTTLRNTLRRRAQGSLSSGIESEVEPRRKKRKVENGSTSNESRTVSDEDVEEKSTSDSSDEETRQLPSPITTRLRARELQVYERHESPPPRPVNLTRRIREDSDDEPMPDSTTKQKKRLVIESDSSAEESEPVRERHVSTSSSLSTIPCRNSDTQLKAIISTPNADSHTKSDDESSNSSEATDSEYNPTVDDTDWRPSTSNKKVVQTKVQTRRRKTQKSETPKRRSGRVKVTRKRSYGSSDTSVTNEYRAPPAKLQGAGRENHLPSVGGDDVTAKYDLRVRNQPTDTNRSFSSSGSILSENNDSQSNLRHTTSNNVTQPTTSPLLPTKQRIILSLKNVQRNNSHQSMQQHTNVPSTSQAVSEDTHTPYSPSQSNVSSVSDSQSQCFMTKISNYVSKSLGRYYDDQSIDETDFESLNDRIVEKICKKKTDKPDEKKIEDFVAKYMTYHLSKRKVVR